MKRNASLWKRHAWEYRSTSMKIARRGVPLPPASRLSWEWGTLGIGSSPKVGRIWTEAQALVANVCTNLGCVTGSTVGTRRDTYGEDRIWRRASASKW